MKKVIKEKKRIAPLVMSEEEFGMYLLHTGQIREIPKKENAPIDINHLKYKIIDVVRKYDANS